MELPKDPVVLLSFINTKLRDFYPDLESLCNDLNINQSDLTEELKKIDYFYDTKSNQFK